MAILAGVADLVVVALVARLFTVVVGGENRPSIPWEGLVPEDPRVKVVVLVVAFVAAAWFSSLSKLLLRAFQLRLKAAIWRDLSDMAQRKLIAQPYVYFLGESRSDISSMVLINVARVADIVVLPLLQLASGVFVIILLSAGMLIVGKLLAVALILGLLAGYLLISTAITPFLRFAARQRILLELRTNTILSESMRTILDVQLTGSEPYFERHYQEAGRETIPFIWKADVLPETPRALIEPLGITMIFAAGMLPLLSNPDPGALLKIIPFLATVAVTSLKLTPPLQDSFRAITSLRAGLPDLEETLKLIELPEGRLTIRSVGVPSPDGVMPKRVIRLKNVSYRYPGTDADILRDISMSIPVGSRVAFVGATGSGKTTTANQLLCLLRPSSGTLQLDGIDVDDADVPAWQANCAYVPQSINLLNSNIIENIAFAEEVDAVDQMRVWEALQAAQLADLVAELPLGLFTPIGDNGIRLSGGQRQRLALARAFYRNSKFLVLDEATSALDNRTESEVMDAIEVIGRRCTLVVIAHRLSTVMRSDCIFEFEAGRIKAFGSFEQLRQRSETFNDLASFERRLSSPLG
ncbi:ABC transporter ATP-binding protein [Synechococcus sp. BA-132 BA5]|uniref:ABC transporter ATP-binding protein n=1 Tax=Synechococcus sp. BA-132 BA5 TaxID=3110252 RepID=UPI002B1F052F|nr:ABC transporter ATP-binding protein [Synechococcus sp. BA-132 BA5]MEA5413851.1 ABC transporter ATP-binding protein [Synechococcus sp. BA-132 BA5]